jgi:hypothetical protein
VFCHANHGAPRPVRTFSCHAETTLVLGGYEDDWATCVLEAAWLRVANCRGDAARPPALNSDGPLQRPSTPSHLQVVVHSEPARKRPVKEGYTTTTPHDLSSCQIFYASTMATPPPYPDNLRDMPSPPYQLNPQEVLTPGPSTDSRSERGSRSGRGVRVLCPVDWVIPLQLVFN